METSGNICGRKIDLIPLELISPNPSPARKNFDAASIQSLAASIRANGLLSPLVVRRIGLGRYELIAGERRLRALTILGHARCEAIVIAAFDMDSAIISLIENIQRQQLDFLEEAQACRNIIDKYGITQEELAEKIGKSPSALANRLRLLKLPDVVREYISGSSLTERHARALLGAEDPKVQLDLAREADTKRLTVRQLESRIEKLKPKPHKNMKSICRDMRLYVNAVMDTVSRLRDMGAKADSEILHTDVGFDIIIHLATHNQQYIK